MGVTITILKQTRVSGFGLGLLFFKNSMTNTKNLKGFPKPELIKYDKLQKR